MFMSRAVAPRFSGARLSQRRPPSRQPFQGIRRPAATGGGGVYSRRARRGRTAPLPVMASQSASKSPASAIRLQTPGEEYRHNVGIMLLNGENKAFAAIRLNDPERYWQMPQGGINSGEEPWAAAQRELYEETGVKDIEFLAEVEGWIAYDFPEEARARLYGGWEKYRGQAQKWFMVRLTGPETQLDISGLGEEPEFSEWKWVDICELPGAAVPFKQGVYQQVVAEFQSRIS